MTLGSRGKEVANPLARANGRGGLKLGETSIDELFGTKQERNMLGLKQNKLFTAPAGGLSAQELEECKMAFMVMDMDEDGKVGMDELRTVIQVLGGSPTDEEMNQLMLTVGGEDRALDVHEFIKIVEEGKMDIADHGSAVNIPHLLAIRDSYIMADQDKSGYINHGEFHAMTMAMPAKMRGVQLNRIWKTMAMETHDWSIELVCWIGNYKAWEEDPRRKANFIEEFSAAVADFVKVDQKRVKVASVLKGEKTRLQAVKNLHDVAVAVDADEIATITIVVDTVHVERMRTAAIVGDVEQIKIELDKDVNPNERDDSGKTCLHVGAVEGHEAVVLCLLGGGADHNLKDSSGRTALDLARSTNVDGIVDNDKVIARLEAVEGTLPVAKEYTAVPSSQSAIENFRNTVRTQLKREAEAKGAAAALKGVLVGITLPGMDGTKFRIRKYLHADAEKQISWKGFVNGMARLANSKLGEFFNVQEVAKLDSVLLHKAVDEDEHMRELNHPSVSPMERVGVKFLSNMSRASYFQAQAANSREKQFDDEMGDVGLGKRLPSQAELDFAALDQTLTLSGIGQSSKSGALQGLQDYKNHNREKSQKVIDWCTWRCAIAGAIAATLCAIGDWLQVTLFQGDAVVSCEDNQRKTHHNICPACLDGDPDGDGVQHTIPGMQGICANVANATSYSDIEHQCCAMLCGDSGAEASLFGFGQYEGGHTIDEAAGFCGSDHGDATIAQCYQPECTAQHISVQATLLIVIPITMVSSSIEMGWLYYDVLRTCMQMSHAVGLVLWPLDKERIRIACNLVKAAFEVDDPDDIQYGINPLKDVNSLGRTICAALYAGKSSMSKIIAKLLLKRLMSRVGVRRAADATLSSFVTVPIGFAWNGLVAKQCAHQARLRAVGTITAIECIDKILPIDTSRPEGTVSDFVAKLMLRVIGCAIVAKRGLHPVRYTSHCFCKV